MALTSDQQSLVKQLEALGATQVGEDDVVFEGTRFTLPEMMSLAQAVRFLGIRLEAEEEDTTFSHTYDYRPWDGAYAVNNVMKRVFGAVVQRPTETMFGTHPPALISIRTGPDTIEQVPWGEMACPLFEGTLELQSSMSVEHGSVFRIVVRSKRKYREAVEGLFALVENELATNSLYRSRAFDGAEDANFIDLSKVNEAEVIYSEQTTADFAANIWTALEQTEKCESLGLPMKRAILLEGPYGTGKTLGARLTAKKATDNGWTFIYARPGKDDFHQVMTTAKLYEPAVVFFEDVDVLADADTSDSISKLLDAFDGMTTKSSKVMVILTTNHADRIHKGMVRPGRLDAIIHIGALDLDGVKRMLELTVAEAHRADDLDYEAIFAAMDGYSPAFVKEAITRAIRYALVGGGTLLRTEHFVTAAEGLRPHFALMSDAPERAKERALDSAMVNIVEDVVTNMALDHSEGHVYDLVKRS